MKISIYNIAVLYNSKYVAIYNKINTLQSQTTYYNARTL